MKKTLNDKRVTIKVCDLYYNQKLTQNQICELMGLSRPTVSRLLAEAQECGIVSIKIEGLDSLKHWDAEQSLKEKFGLFDAVVVDSYATDGEIKAALGRAAAAYLEEKLKDGDTVGVAMGSTLYYAAYNSVGARLPDVTFIPLIGGMGQMKPELHSNNLSNQLAERYGGRAYSLYAPARVTSPSLKKEIMKEGSVADVLSLYGELSVALVGIGYPNEASSIKATGYYRGDEIQALTESGVAGEICMQFYNSEGDTAPYKSYNNVIGLDISRLRRVPRSIGVAGGFDKAAAIRGAIAGKYINVLITDRACADALLAE